MVGGNRNETEMKPKGNRKETEMVNRNGKRQIQFETRFSGLESREGFYRRLQLDTAVAGIQVFVQLLSSTTSFAYDNHVISFLGLGDSSPIALITVFFPRGNRFRFVSD